MKATIELCIFKLNFTLNNFEFWDQICSRVFPVKKGKSKHHHWFLRIQIDLMTKFQLKLTISIFWTKFAKKGISGLKQKQKMKITIKFYILKL